MDEESFFTLEEEVEKNMSKNVNKDVLFAAARNPKNSLDVTFAVGAKTT